MIVRLATVGRPELKALLEQSWRQIAPKKLVASSAPKTVKTLPASWNGSASYDEQA